MPDLRILVTNDDGITSPGIQALADALEPLGEVWVCAPDREQSAVSHGISLQRPLRATRLRERWYAIDGTPTDCVMLAVHTLLGARPSLVVSGINNGPNLGDDITYSGTVAGAHEGMLLGIPSLAISNTAYLPEHLETSSHYARLAARYVIEHGLPADTMLNVNVPDLPLQDVAGLAITRMGHGGYEVEIVEREDPRGLAYYWIGGARSAHTEEAGTDLEALSQNKVSVTPLHRDMTNETAVAALASAAFEETAEPQ